MWGVNVKRVMVWVCVLVLLLSTTVPAMANEIEQHKNEAKGVEKDINDTRELLKQVKDEQSQVAQQLEEINKDIKQKEEELVRIEDKLNDIMALLEETRIELNNAEKEAQEFEELMADRLCAMYMMEGTSYLELLFGAKSINEFLDRLEMVKFMITYDEQVFDKMIELKTAIAEKKEELEIQEESIRETKKDISKQKSLIEDKRQERLQVMAQLKKEEEQYEKDLALLEQTSRELEVTIQKLLKQQEENRQRQEEQRKKEEEQQNQSNDGQEKDQSDSGQSGSGDKGKHEQGDQDRGSSSSNETFTWPAPGYNHISSGFGNRWHPVIGEYKHHDGIDISGSGISGKEAVAAANGVVIISKIQTVEKDGKTVVTGYGNYVVIDHGGGITTTYAHGSQRLVSVGQSVKKGQAVLVIGSTGISKGPHLHFEVRKNGVAVNPLPYLGR